MAGHFLTIKEAASILEVTPLTLRNWDARGKLSPTRHPTNNYRIYSADDIKKIIRENKWIHLRAKLSLL